MTSIVPTPIISIVSTQPTTPGNQGVRPNSRPNQGFNQGYHQGMNLGRPNAFPSHIQGMVGNLFNQWGSACGQPSAQPAPINIGSLPKPVQSECALPPMVSPNEDPNQKPPGQNQPTQALPPFVAPNEDPFQRPHGQIGNTGPIGSTDWSQLNLPANVSSSYPSTPPASFFANPPLTGIAPGNQGPVYSPAPGQPGFKDLY